ncbi:hypothetical protein SAMN05216389_10139 [Oceanobacillus limi]|uniref:Uncharacterized protein n=1 Tax=Oceanobacillus limi TaxID=930131 RepID=A0A1H9XZJ2_9BACI|nr:hypothetical protein [Oceanobacillus limi]SES61809.1 hypothetical protein SAMN05216389_10139 [Oceanobacillus limi]
MYEIGEQRIRSGVFQFSRTVHGKLEYQELIRNVEQAGARIINETPLDNQKRVNVLLEVDRRKRQY